MTKKIQTVLLPPRFSLIVIIYLNYCKVMRLYHLIPVIRADFGISYGLN